MTECDKIQEILPAYLEGLASPSDSEMVSSHLASCRECSYAVKVLMKSQKLITNLEEVEPPPWLKTRIMARLEDGVEQEEEKKWNFGRLKNLLLYPLKIKIPLQAFTVLLVAVVVVYVYRTIQPEVKLAGRDPQAVATFPAEKDSQTVRTEARPKIQERAPGGDQPQPSAKTMSADDEKWPAGIREIFKGSANQQQASPPALKSPQEITKDQEVQPATEPEAKKANSPKAFLSNAPSVPGASAPASAEDRARTEQKPETEKGRSTGVAPRQEVLALTVQVNDINTGSNNVEAVLRDLNVPVSRESREGSTVISTEAPAQKAKEIIKRLNSVGRLHQRNQLSETATDKNISIRIQILQKQP